MSSKPRCSCCYSWWLEGKLKRAEFRADHGSDGWEETPHKKKGKAKKRSKERNRCPENDGQGHVYVWITEAEYYGYPWWYKYRVAGMKSHYEYRVCCGCGYRPKHKSFRVVRH